MDLSELNVFLPIFDITVDDIKKWMRIWLRYVFHSLVAVDISLA